MKKKVNPIAQAQAKAPPPVLKVVKNLSPSAVFLLEKQPIEFFFRYMLDGPRVEFEQTRPMAFGSAFDGRVKELLALANPGKFKAADYGLLQIGRASCRERV